MDLFKEEFKYFKRKRPPPDLSGVIDFDAASKFSDKIEKVCLNCEDSYESEVYSSLGLMNPSSWTIFNLLQVQGLTVITNPFKAQGQQKWIEKCLTLYPRKPNITNVDAHIERPDEDLWEMFHSDDPKVASFYHQLRWTTLGYHHNWDTKEYSKFSYTPFPSCLGNLTKVVGRALGYQNFNPQAAIINYYHMDSSLSGHTDHSEIYLEAPLFSFSFGQTAVFLIGGKTKAIRPVALFLKSGDIVVMSKESRLAYHGVPLIVENTKTPWYEDEEINPPWPYFDNYIRRNRINMNVRQILAPGQELTS